ncbi:MAG: transglycosylase domain-containing protein, partial [Candidatus Paceibacteria bacterium]
GKRVQGGSTITQQLVKNSLLTPERTIKRKIKELVLAIRLERQFSKDEILGFYLNQIPYGSNAYGIESASQTFFAKPAKELTLEEAALLAALPKAPSYFSPFGSHTDELKKRQEYILDRMAEAGFIKKEEAENAKNKKLSFASRDFGSLIRAPHFVIQIKEILEKTYGPDVVETGGLKVITTLDWKAQEIAERAVKEGALANDVNWQAGNAAMVVQDAKTGEILAWVGARGGFQDKPKPAGCEPGVNCKFEPYVNAPLRLRQPGSAFKPFVYVSAFKKGYTPDTVIFDVPTEFTPNHPLCPTIPDFSNELDVCYHPKNYDEKFRGPVTLRKALAQSLNVPSVKVLYLAGVAESIKTAQDFGITTLTESPNFYGLSLVLGGGGVRLDELVNAYAVFAQDGIWRPQINILRVEDASGRVLQEAKTQQKRVIDAQYARLINDILSDDQARVPAFQPGGPLTLPDRKVAAKTGTSQDYRDAWIIGYTPSVVAGVWVGNNDNRPMIKGGAGVMAAAPIWRAFMEEYLKNSPQEDFVKPEPVSATKPVLNGEYIVDYGGPQIHS